MLLSQFTHRQQRRESDCLVACAAMVLNHLGLAIDDARLAKILRAGADFTPFTHLRYLEQLGLSVITGEQGDVSLFATYIALGLPVVVGSKTLLWPHWGDLITEHAVVVVGIDQAQGVIYLHDPFFAEAPIEMELLRFETGWEEKERQYAIVGLAPLEEQS
jgi:ABC-type bacteriocin/lantibiotic exporter with double-glycine peptidase domain